MDDSIVVNGVTISIKYRDYITERLKCPLSKDDRCFFC